MLQLNHQHLYYFWIVAKEGSISRACPKLFLTQPAVSSQIIKLEHSLGKKLFHRKNRRLTLTEDGMLVLDYANQIFSLSEELLDALGDRPNPNALRVQIGIVDQMPQKVSQRLLAEIFKYPGKVLPLVVRGPLTALLNDLRSHTLDLVLSNEDVPLQESAEFIHATVESLPVVFVAAPHLAKRVKKFPEDLSEIPILLPGSTNPIRDSFEHFLNRHNVTLQIAGEIRDNDLLRWLALDGVGATPLNQIDVEEDLRSGCLVRLHKRPTGIVNTIWLISRKRHHLNPIAKSLLSTFKLKTRHERVKGL
jgi:LysR family transcriptional activator of nhaA